MNFEDSCLYRPPRRNRFQMWWARRKLRKAKL